MVHLSGAYDAVRQHPVDAEDGGDVIVRHPGEVVPRGGGVAVIRACFVGASVEPGGAVRDRSPRLVDPDEALTDAVDRDGAHVRSRGQISDDVPQARDQAHLERV
jgi:hypothetical protein